VVLERFEFHVSLSNLSLAQDWIYRTLRSVTSSGFSEFVVVLSEGYTSSPAGVDGWKAVDELLNTLVERNPGFRVVFRGCFYSFQSGLRDGFQGARSIIEDRFPLALSNGLVKFECVPRSAENRYKKLGVL